jgi:hypothetical protein
MMPLILFLLELFLNRLFLPFDPFVLLNKPIDLYFELVKIVDRHRAPQNFMLEFSFNL